MPVLDTVGLLLAVMATAVSVTDCEAGRALLARLCEWHWRIGLVWADGGCAGRLVDLARDAWRIVLTGGRTQRRHYRVHGAALEVAGRAAVRVADALTPSRPRLRGPH
ncbi:hypothetical protein ACFW1A_36310 [Kitasatospora sp. NPDC058965]|uniref:hypothetical protein n=1 Tax=Kitasatospora sp. NPDC058965 TaxID=3346682 RepID=UPI00369B6C32